MNISLSKGEMLERCRLVCGLEHERTDCSIEATDGLAVDRMLEEQLRRAYTELLQEGPTEVLTVEDFGPELGAAQYKGLGLGVVALPPDCVRLLDIRLEEWDRSVEVAPAEDLGSLMMRGDNPYTMPSEARPGAAMGPDGRSVYVYPHSGTANVAEGHGVRDPGPERYKLQESGLSRIFEKIKIDI